MEGLQLSAAPLATVAILNNRPFDFLLSGVQTAFDGYFGGQAPFGTGKKKDEFPDALALHDLEATTSVREKSFLVVSKDGDWRTFCEQSQRLYFISELETALALLKDPPLVVRQSVLGWLAASGDGRAEIRNELEGVMTNPDVDVNGYATSGEIRAIPHGTELRNVEWADDADVDIIETSDPDEQGIVTAVLSMPLQIDLRAEFFCLG